MATSNPGCGTSFIKYLMFFFNFLFCMCGLTLIVVGAVINLKYGTYLSYARADYFIIAVGAIVFVVGFFGSCGVVRLEVRGSSRIIKPYAVMLSIVVVLEIAVGILGYAYRNQMKDVATKALNRGVDNYSSETGAKHFMDWVQNTFQCCGYSGSANYHNQTITCGKGNGTPSCHVGGTCKGEVNDIGCTQKFVEFFKENLSIIGAVAIVIASIQVFSVIFSCLIIKFARGL